VTPELLESAGKTQTLHLKNQKDKTTKTWLTPPDLLGRLGRFDLDPCAATNAPWPTASRHYTEADDGLSQPWEGRVWCNPPYGTGIGRWMERMASHGNGIALVFARTDTEPWRSAWEHGDGFLFITGRLRFRCYDGSLPESNGGAPSVLIAYGAVNVHTLKTCGIRGAFVEGARLIGQTKGGEF
jgi:hypothetical protein